MMETTAIDPFVSTAAAYLAGPAHSAAPQLTITSGTASVLWLGGRRCLLAETTPLAHDDTRANARAVEIQLRALSSEAELLARGLGQGFRIEDLVLLELRCEREAHAQTEAWWRRRVLPETTIRCVSAGTTHARAIFAERGEIATSSRTEYSRDPERAGRIRVEAFELHVTEHCNLRCAHCCNTSPYLPKKALAPDDIAATLGRMAEVLHADVFKIMGGEPLLHPHITEVLHVVRKSGIGDVVRLFTNGLLLSKMDDAFWRALDHLTVSSYESAPVRPEQLAHIEKKAREFDVVLNVKPVSVFSQVMHDARRRDDAAVLATFQGCWLRHRCLVARDGRFYVCTRAAYLDDLHEHVQLEEPFDDPAQRRREDSVALDAPDLQTAVLDLLNRKTPLNSCRFCLGGDGPRERHSQLTRDDVRSGRLRRLPMSPV